jgi:hypothetical protein
MFTSDPAFDRLAERTARRAEPGGQIRLSKVSSNRDFRTCDVYG